MDRTVHKQKEDHELQTESGAVMHLQELSSPHRGIALAVTLALWRTSRWISTAKA